MKTLTIRRKIPFPGFGAHKWKKPDHKKPLSIQVKNAKALIYLEEDRLTKQGIIVFPRGSLELVFSPPPRKVIADLKKGGVGAAGTANVIHDLYLEAMRKFEALLMSTGKVRSLLSTGVVNINEFFDQSRSLTREALTWQIDDGPVQKFTPKLPQPHGKHPLYKVDQLITPSKWRALQDVADNQDIPSDELLELYRIRSKVSWQMIRIATIEASIVSESLLRQYGLLVLKKNGFSNTKIKRMRDELSFNNLLNIVLPLSLTKTELRKVSGAIQAVDNLRRIRNDLVHGNITEKDVDRDNVSKGIDGAIKLAEFLKKYISNAPA